MSLEEIADGSFSYLNDVFEDIDFYVSTDAKRGILKNTGKFRGGGGFPWGFIPV